MGVGGGHRLNGRACVRGDTQRGDEGGYYGVRPPGEYETPLVGVEGNALSAEGDARG